MPLRNRGRPLSLLKTSKDPGQQCHRRKKKQLVLLQAKSDKCVYRYKHFVHAFTKNIVVCLHKHLTHLYFPVYDNITFLPLITGTWLLLSKVSVLLPNAPLEASLLFYR